MKSIFKTTAVAAVAFACATVQQAQALQVELTSGASSSGVISDNGAGDLLGLAGQIIYSGSVGNWTISTETATSKDIIGSAQNPVLNLASFNSTTTGSADSLRILVTDTSFTGSPVNFLSIINAAANSGVGAQFNVYADAANAAFGLTTLLTSSGSLSGLFNNSTLSGVNSFANPYSLTLELILTSTGSGAVSFDASTQSVPDGGTTVILLGAALSGLGLIRRKLA